MFVERDGSMLLNLTTICHSDEGRILVSSSSASASVTLVPHNKVVFYFCWNWHERDARASWES